MAIYKTLGFIEMEMLPISVVMPVYNGEKYIKKTIESILSQTYSNFELLIIDDCGNDKSMEIVRNTNDNRIRIITNEQNMGIAYSRNVGIKNARGKYIALMDDDDLAPLDRLMLEYNYLEKHKDIDAVGGRYCIINENDEIVEYSPDTLQNPKYIKANLLFYDPIGNGSMMFRKSIVDEYDILFRDDCLGMEDYLFWIEFSKYGNITNLKDIMLYWRHIQGNETSRVVSEKSELRVKKFAEIQKYALKNNGISLCDTDYEFLSRMLPEGRLREKISKKDLERLYDILCLIINKADDLQLDYANEVKIACRKQFSRRLECSEIW